MKGVEALTQKQLSAFLLNVAVVRPVFIWGPPGIGKSALVEEFAASVGLPCVSLLGSQLAPEDLIGVPKITDGKTRFHPPATIARDEPFCLFLDELNACSHEVQKAFYSLIHDRRIGEYELPPTSIVVGAGNRAQDSAIVKPMSSALLNRMVHVQLRAAPQDWLEWAYGAGIHPWVIEYVTQRPNQLWSQPPKTEEPFSTPRAWHMLSDALHQLDDPPDEQLVNVIAGGCLTPNHAKQFGAFVRKVLNQFSIESIIDGEEPWPAKPEDRDVLYFLVHSFRDHLLAQLPERKEKLSGRNQRLVHRSKAMLKDLARINVELAQLVIADEDLDGHVDSLPDWFLIEVGRDLPRIVSR